MNIKIIKLSFMDKPGKAGALPVCLIFLLLFSLMVTGCQKAPDTGDINETVQGTKFTLRDKVKIDDQLDLGENLIEKGKYLEAEDLMKKILRQKPDMIQAAEAHLLLGTAKSLDEKNSGPSPSGMKTNEYKKSLDTASRLLDKAGKDSKTARGLRLKLADRYKQNNLNDLYLKELNKLSISAPHSPEGLLARISEIQFQQPGNDRNSSLSKIDELLAEAGGSIDSKLQSDAVYMDFFYKLGETCFALREYEKALPLLEAVIKSPSFCILSKNDAKVRVARIYQKTGKNKKAILLLEEVISQTPDKPFANEARVYLGGILLENGDIKGAITYLRKVSDTIKMNLKQQHDDKNNEGVVLFGMIVEAISLAKSKNNSLKPNILAIKNRLEYALDRFHNKEYSTATAEIDRCIDMLTQLEEKNK